MSKSAQNCLHTKPQLPKPPTPTPHTAAMADPKNTPKGGCAGFQNGPKTEEGNYDKGKTRDKYRTAILKQANQMAQKTQMGDPQRPQHGGNHINPEKTLTDTQHAEPACNMDERGNNEANPDTGGIPPMQITEQGQQSLL